MTDATLKKMKITRWFPDTCSCVLDYSWDQATSEDERVHTPHKVADTCPVHDHLRGDLHAHHAAVQGENSHKNLAIAHTLEHLPDEHKVVVGKDDKGNDMHGFMYQPLWSFNDKRELELTLRHASDEVKANISARLKEKFPDRVTHVK